MSAGQATGTQATSLRERKKQRARDALYEAALELLGERPYDKVSVDDICARAEVGRASFYRFYGTKVGLVTEFNRRLAVLVREAIDRRAARGQHPPGAVERLRILQETLAEHWTMADRGARTMALAFVAEGTIAMVGDAADTVYRPLLDLVIAIVTEGQASGELTTPLAPGLAAWLIMTALAAATSTWLTGQSPGDLHRTTADALNALLFGMS
ncbi:helix-turn-helix domain-containing protein [Actinocorallia libanotica]|uniref:HTH tetR-type domain-containing protein n=1 Tax=Actinocorallia libanotica TaxID=46162 RepID=A0ABN1QJW0_9ACTN